MATIMPVGPKPAGSDYDVVAAPRRVRRNAAASRAAPPSLFTNPQHEALVVFDAPAWASPRSEPFGAHYRAFDIALALLMLMLLWPVMLGAALLVRVSGPGPVIFRHARIGRDGARFLCLKYRTMDVGADGALRDLLGSSGALRREWQENQKMQHDPRVTAIGQVLRRFSIDELPQLINVLRGDMSIVGPRPIVDAEVERYAQYFSDYCRVKPGLTGLWQVSGRNRLPYERRIELDSQYARTKSLLGDAWIVARTVPVVFQGSGC